MRMKEIRLNKGMTQKQLAEKSGVKLRTVQQYENKARNIEGANLHTLTAIASTLEVKIYELLDDETLIEKIKKTI